MFARFVISLLACAAAGSAAGQVHFEDVTDGSGLEYAGESYGGSWGDINNDRLPDLLVNHHRNPSGLYVNLGNGRFEDRGHTIDAWIVTPRSDVHGGTFADVDNDGWQDLVITAGSKNYTQFLVNDGTTLHDRINDFSFGSIKWSGRYPVWNDFNNDGLLDVAFIVQRLGVQLYLQESGDFVLRNGASGHACTDGDYSLLSDLTNDGFLDWICVRTSALPERIYDTTGGLPFRDRTSLSASLGNILDAATADFDGDQRMDMFALRGKLRINGAEIVDPDSIEAHFTNAGSSESGMTFRSTGNLSVELHWSDPVASQVYIGSGGRHPPSASRREPLRFNLSPTDPTVVGVVPHKPALNRGVYIGYTPATKTWSFSNSAGGSADASYTYTYIDSSAAISNITVSGIPELEQPQVPALYKYDGSRYVNQVAGSGVDHPVLCNSVAAADFDNDMDVDLYYVCRAGVSNLPNRLYLNDGSGRFSRAPAPFGGEGLTGPGVGIGENVFASDYDVDGFMDLYVTNGLHLYPEPPNYTSGGPDNLLRNLGNANHWAEFDLRGKASNRDGIGATVIVTAGGKAQRREANGGYKRWAQHHRRLHFGLGANTKMNVAVHWPSGAVDNYSNVATNRLYAAIEGAAALVPVTVGKPSEPVACGAPTYDRATERALFVWRDCASGAWSVRVTGGGGSSTYTGGVVADAAFTSVTPISVEAGDVFHFTLNPGSIDFGLAVGAAGQDGFNFSLPAGRSACLTLSAPAVPIYAGRTRVQVTSPVDLASMGPCSTVP